tara:strand:- start:72033 stop:72869 length:837 start_codon:yes stop_codon:yes gene_type:complete
MATPTKAEIAQKIQTKILALTAPGSITKANVAEILGDLNNLAAPSVTNGNSVEIGEYNERTIFRKIVEVASGNDLEAADFSIPANHVVSSFTVISEWLSNYNINFEIQAETIDGGNVTEAKIVLNAYNDGDGRGISEITGQIDAIVTFPDATTQAVNIEVVAGSGYYPVALVKDLSAFDLQMDIEVEILNTSNITCTSPWGSKTFNALQKSETVNYDRSEPYGTPPKVNILTGVDLPVVATALPSSNKVSVESIYFGATNDPQLQNIVACIEYMEPAP